MTDDGDEPGLEQILGEIALADSEVDHWLAVIFGELLRLPPEVVRILIRNDSSEAKATKLRRLLDLQAQGEGLSALRRALASAPKLKQRRDEALHSFYLAHEVDEFRRFRTRSDTADTSLTALSGLRDMIRELNTHLEEGALQLGLANASEGDVDELFRDCFEVLAALRLNRRSEFQSLIGTDMGETVILALRGQGRWEVAKNGVPADLSHESSPVLAYATIWPSLGKVRLQLRGGAMIEGGDTGWRDVLSAVKTVTPDANQRYWRRINGTEQYVADEGTWWPPPGLAERLTSESARDLVDRWQAERSTFLPPSEQPKSGSK